MTIYILKYVRSSSSTSIPRSACRSTWRSGKQDHPLRGLYPRDPDFLPVDDVAIAFAHGGRVYLGSVAAGGGFGDAHRLQAPLATGDPGQVKPLLRFRAMGSSSVFMLYVCPWHAPELPPLRLISSMITDASARPRPEPPYSVGISAASQPARVSASTKASG